MATTWILAADRAQARLYRLHGRGKPLSLIEQFEHPEGRAHEGDLVTDSGAAVMQSGGQGQRRDTEPEVSATEHEAQVFAGQLAQRLSRGRVERAFESLVLIAPPAFLGVLRKALDRDTRRCVKHEIDKNLLQYSDQKLGQVISQTLYI
ncbi:MAG: host attachment protein [Halioglobus sp.]|nr:host attachment protein [Halioglobus sp.]